jgi:hypothetical protein
MILDYSNLIVRGHLPTGANIKITAFAPPIIDKVTGVAASIGSRRD